MFSSDYPHRHSEERLDAVPAGLSDPVLAKMLADNAREHYRLADERLPAHKHRRDSADAHRRWSTATSTTRRSPRRRCSGYMPASWRERRATGGRLDAAIEATRETLGDRSYLGAEYPRPTPRAARTDSWPPNGRPAGVDLAFCGSSCSTLSGSSTAC